LCSDVTFAGGRPRRLPVVGGVQSPSGTFSVYTPMLESFLPVHDKI